MPIPRPRKGEKQDDYIPRCHRAIADEFPDNAQRHAVCMQTWRDRNKRRAEVALEDAHREAFLSDDPRCLAMHIGPWAIYPPWFQQAVDILKRPLPMAEHLALMRQGGLLHQDAEPSALGIPLAFSFSEPEAALEDEADDDRPYFTSQGVGVIRVVGQMQKGMSKFGGTSTILTRRALRMARSDPSVKAILLAVDSPGGMVAGTPELAQEVMQTRGVKPIRAYIEDLGASAAYWVASQADSIAANPTAQIGSIGVRAVLHDSSGVADRSGLAVHVVSTGPYKGMGAPGAKVLPEHLSEIQTQVADLGEHFFRAVQEGRGFSATQMGRVDDGRVWIAEKARTLGLIDKVQSFDAALGELVRLRPRSARTSASLEAELAAIRRIPQGG